jgi:hypothetical protein
MPCYSLTLTWISRTRLDRRKVAMLVTRLTPSDEQANDTCRTPPPSSPDQEVGYAVHIGRFFFAANGAVPHELAQRLGRPLFVPFSPFLTIIVEISDDLGLLLMH